MPRIQANRDTIDDRFSVLGFTVRTESPLFEVAVATDPNLFKPENRTRRARSNFFSSRAQGVTRARRGEAVYLVPPDVLASFVGQPRLYFGLATYRENSRGTPDFVQAPTDGSMYVGMSQLTERGLRRSAGAQTSLTYGNKNGRDTSLDWGGDASREGTAVAPAAARSATATAPAPAVAMGAVYDDGFGAFPDEPLPAAAQDRAHYGQADEPIVRPQEVLLRSYDGGLLSQIRLFAETAAWIAGVSDTSRLPHSAICLVLVYNGDVLKGRATAFYIGRNLLMTNAHVVKGHTKLVVIPGKNGAGTDAAHEPFGRFSVDLNIATSRPHPSYNGGRAHDMAIVKAPRAAPNDRWLSPIEELRQSRPEGVGVCGYSAHSRRGDLVATIVHATLDPEKQHVHRGYVRTVDEDSFTYDVQELAGSSGSPVYWIEGGVAPRVHVVGVNAGPRDDTTNEGCRLTDAKLAWIRGIAAEWGIANAMQIGESDEAAQALEIPLDPGAGGRSIGTSAMRAGDIIVSTTRAFASRLIRLGTVSPVSHVMLYVGDGKVIEAVGSGVREVTLEAAIGDAILAVAYRHPQLDAPRAAAVVAHARSRIGHPYNIAGAAFQGYRILNPLPAAVIEAIGRRLGVEAGQAGAVYCSELVLECFERAGVALTVGARPAQSTPDQVAQFARSSLGYVGHLKAEDVPMGVQLGMSDAGDVVYDPATGEPMAQPVQAMTIGPEDVARAQRYAPEWRDLFNWSTPADVAAGVAARGMSVQRIADARGELNLDRYEVRITRLPTGHTATSFFAQFRAHLNDFVDTRNSEFIAYTPGTDDVRWASANPVGTVHKIDIVGPKNAAVVTSLYEPTRWRFSTITTPWSGAHPVSGHREFGVREDGGATILYTRAADRATGSIGETVVWLGADQLWRSMQTRVADWVNQHGGAATVVARFSERFHPEVVRILYGTPSAQALEVDNGSGNVFGDALADFPAGAGPARQSTGTSAAGEPLLPAPPPALIQQPLELDAPMVEAQAVPVLIPIAAAVIGAVFTRLLSNTGDVSWELDQMNGLKHPNDQLPSPLPAFRDGAVIRLTDWPSARGLGSIAAGFEIRWQHNGQSLGNVQINNVTSQDTVGWGLRVKARIMNDSIVYPRNAPRFAAIKVRIEYQFTRTGHSDLLAYREIHLFGDGTYNLTGDWTQNTFF